jgi:hypothetical protein
MGKATAEQKEVLGVCFKKRSLGQASKQTQIVPLA